VNAGTVRDRSAAASLQGGGADRHDARRRRGRDGAVVSLDLHADVVLGLLVPIAVETMCEFVGIPGEQVTLFNQAVDAEVALPVPPWPGTQWLRHTYVKLQHFIADEMAKRLMSPRDDYVAAIAHAQPPGRTALSSSRGSVRPLIDR
jgi:cytochrome P450